MIKRTWRDSISQGQIQMPAKYTDYSKAVQLRAVPRCYVSNTRQKFQAFHAEEYIQIYTNLYFSILMKKRWSKAWIVLKKS